MSFALCTPYRDPHTSICPRGYVLQDIEKGEEVLITYSDHKRATEAYRVWGG